MSGSSLFDVETMQHGAARMVPLIAVTGYQDSGKTTATEAIVRELCRRSYRVGTFKHCHHGYDLDRPGKDSWRHRRAGATRTVLTAPGGFALLSDPLPEEDLHQMAGWLFPDVDLVLAEGYHWLPLARVEIQARDGSTRPGHPGGRTLGLLPYGFDAADISELCDLLEQRFLS
jgi:molybdopterin-guanine dinucleotide biosynthesis protein MobB